MENEMPLRFLSSPTTKVRRLGYFVLIVKELEEKSLSFRSLTYDLLQAAEVKHSDLEEYCKTLPVIPDKKSDLITGEIKTEDAARRYIKTAQEVGLIKYVAREFFNTKYGNILANLPCSNNIFKLSLEQKFFLLKLLCKLDYDCLRILVALIKSNIDLKNFPSKFQECLIKFLEKKPSCQKRRDKIERWKKRDEYVIEHIKAPRLEWFTDLGLITFWNKKTGRVYLNEKISAFFEEEFNSSDFENQYPQKFNLVYSKELKSSVREFRMLGLNEKSEYLKPLLQEAFERFKPHPDIPKISADEFIEYSTVLLLVRFGLLATKSVILEALQNVQMMEKLKLRFTKMYSLDDTGFIQKI